MSNPLSKLSDYHTHSALCKHAQGELWQYAKRAKELGLAEIGFSDHGPVPNGFDSVHRMDIEEMPLYLEMIEEARAKVPDFPILFGAECDFHERTIEWLEIFLKQYDFDYVLGSVHYVGDWELDNLSDTSRYDEDPIEYLWEIYFELWRKAVSSGYFNIMAHPDLVKITGKRPSGDLTRFFSDALDDCKRHGVALEVSTAGLRKPVGEIYPGPEFLRLAKEKDIPIVISSDAHKPEQVGMDFEKALEFAKSVGYTEVARFKKRQIEMIKF